MCLLREPIFLDLEPSCSYTECIDKKKSQEACSTPMVLQPPSRTLLEGTLGSPQIPDMLQSAGCHTLGHVAPFPNSTKASSIAPLPSCTASLISSALPYPAPSHPGWTWPHHSGQSRVFLPAGAVGLYQLWLFWHNTPGEGTQGTTQRDQEQRRHLWHLLCVVGYITLWYSRVDVAWRHSWCAGNSWMFQNKEHVGKSVV